jgi:hypothetical protein
MPVRACVDQDGVPGPYWTAPGSSWHSIAHIFLRPNLGNAPPAHWRSHFGSSCWSDRSHLRRLCSSRGFCRTAIVLQSEPVAWLRCRPHPSSLYSGIVISIFLAVDRCHVRGVSIEIRPSDSKLLPVCIDPFPEGFSGSKTLRPCRTIDAHNIRRKPVAIASTEATSMIGPVVGRLKAACNRLAIVIAERAGYAR